MDNKEELVEAAGVGPDVRKCHKCWKFETFQKCKL
jgi:hypothetical protein